MPLPIAVPLAIAGASLVGSAINSWTTNKAAERELAAKEAAAKKLLEQGQITQDQYDNIVTEINNYWKDRGSLGKEEDVTNYRNAIEGYNPTKYVGEEQDKNWKFRGSKEDYINPHYAQIIGDTAASIQHTAAGAGAGRGTGAALNIAQGVANKSDELYRTAMQDYQNERDFAYKTYSDAIANNQRRLDSLRAATESKINMQGGLAQDYFATKDAAQADRIKAEQDKLAAKQMYDTAAASLY